MVNNRISVPLSLRHRLPGLWLLGVVPVLLMQCGAGRMESVWDNGRVSIDGTYPEWRDCLYADGAKKALIGCMNDSASLYLCFVSRDRQLVSQLMHGGCRVRFGKKKEMQAFPEVVVMARGRRPMMAGAEERRFGDGSDSADGQNEECMVRLIEPHASGSGMHPSPDNSPPENKLGGVRAALREHDGCAVLELALPFMMGTGGNEVSIVRDSLVTLTVETMPDRQPRHRDDNHGGGGHQPSGMPPGGGGGGMHQGGGGMGMGGGGGMNPPGGGGMEHGEQPQEAASEFSLCGIVHIAGKPKG